MKLNRIIILTISILMVFTLSSCGAGETDFDATGSFEATEIIVSSQANGLILELNAEEGQQLQEGELVGVIDSTQLHLQKLSLLSSARGVRAQQPDIRKQTAAIQEQINTLERNESGGATDRIERGESEATGRYRSATGGAA